MRKAYILLLIGIVFVIIGLLFCLFGSGVSDDIETKFCCGPNDCKNADYISKTDARKNLSRIGGVLIIIGVVILCIQDVWLISKLPETFTVKTV